MRNRFLRAIQPLVSVETRPKDMLPYAICCCCSVKGQSFLPAPAPEKLFLPTPFIVASKMMCSDCFEENEETGRRELMANVVNLTRKVGEGVCHSQMKMWTHTLPSQTVLPRGANIDSYVRETKSRCIDSGIMLPALRVSLVELGKRRPKASKRGVDGRLEDDFNWRRTRESNFVVEKFTVQSLAAK